MITTKENNLEIKSKLGTSDYSVEITYTNATVENEILITSYNNTTKSYPTMWVGYMNQTAP